jgi:hypothetical protein
VLKLCYFHRWDLLHFLRRFPKSFLLEVLFLLTGIEIVPDPPIVDSHLPFNIASYPEKLILGKPSDRIIIRVRLVRRSSLLPGLDYAVLRGGDKDEDVRSCACGSV